MNLSKKLFELEEKNDEIRHIILSKLQFDQLHFIDDILTNDQKATKMRIDSLFHEKSFPKYLKELNTEQLVILKKLSNDLYSPKSALGVILKKVTPEKALELSSAEESHQLTKWPMLPDYHESNIKLKLSQIYYYLLLLEIIGL